ncbi:MAG: DNA polymerase III subunit beta [Candidatus Dojkabacteria bacterium]
MKITLNHEKLSKLLNYASRAVSSKPNIPILSNVKLDVTKNDLKLSATNLDMGINVWIPGVVETEGSITVSAKFLADFVSASTSDNVELELKDTVLNVKTSKSKANFNTIPAAEYPVLPKVTETKFFSIDSEELLKSLDKVIFSCSTDMSPGKIQQTGVLFEVSADEDSKSINLIGLDGFRLSKREIKVKELNKELTTQQIIVPAKYLQEMMKIVSDMSEVEAVDVYLSENKSQIIFKIEEIEFSVRLLEGPYPDYKRILPDSSSYTFDVEKKEFESAIKVISTFARSNLAYKTLFDLDLENKQVKLKSSVADVGENETIIQVENIEGESDLNAAYNLRYLQDIVAHISGDKLKFETKGALSASVFRDLGDEKFMHLLMPLRREV